VLSPSLIIIQSFKFNNMKFSAPVATVVRRASGNATATEIFANKTVAEVYNEYKLSPSDITIGLAAEGDDDTLGFLFKIGDVKWAISLSGGLKSANDSDLVLDDTNYFWRCEFRENAQSIRKADGTQELDNDGNIILSKTNKVITLGKPSGGFGREVDAFDTEEADTNTKSTNATAKVG
jgi:hypothetical protein